MKTNLFFVLLLLTCSAHADVYKWVDANGKITYSDTPPTGSAKQLQKKALASTDGDESSLPYSIAVVSRNHPVTLYTSAICTPCDSGRALLKKRGIPFSEKTVTTQDDMNALKKAGGEGRLPHLSLGSTQVTGFDVLSWNSALTAAGYPESSHLPGNYRSPPAQPAASSASDAGKRDPK